MVIKTEGLPKKGFIRIYYDSAGWGQINSRLHQLAILHSREVEFVLLITYIKKANDFLVNKQAPNESVELVLIFLIL